MKNKFDTFVRYGGLSPVKQDIYDASMPSYHSPPARHGIYAFLKNNVEMFLLGKKDFDQRRFNWVKDENGEKISADDERAEKIYAYSCKHKDGKFYLCKPSNRKVFKYVGELWHHHGEFCPENEIIQRKGAWVLTTHSTYVKAVKKCLSIKDKYYKQNKIKYTNDDMEIFIERLK